MVDFSMTLPDLATVIGIFLACALGFPVPEEITLIFAGIWVSTKQLTLILAVLSGWSGLLMSDWTLFFLGRHLGPRIFHLPFLKTVLTETRVKWAEALVNKNGPFFCFIGRFLTGLRVVIFTTFGALGLRPQIFMAIDIMASLVSVSIWIFFGYWMASHFIDATRYAHEIRLVLASIAILFSAINITRQLINRKRTGPTLKKQ